MNEEKIYSQEELNQAITKAICDMSKVLEKKDAEIKILEEQKKGEWIYERPNGKTYSDFVYCSECQNQTGFIKQTFVQIAEQT